MEMNWEAIGSIGEIVGAITVVLTLGYLAIQTKQNTLAIRATSFMESQHFFDNYRSIEAANPITLNAGGFGASSSSPAATRSEI